MHSLIADHPEFVEFTKARAKAEDDRVRYAEQATKRQKAFEAASLHAFETGGTIPMAPQNPQAGEQAFRDRCRQIDAMTSAWIVENDEELTAALLAREDDIVAEAARLVARLDDLVGEAAQLRASLANVHRQGGDLVMPPSTGTNFDLLVRSARTDTRMLREPFVQAVQYVGAGR